MADDFFDNIDGGLDDFSNTEDILNAAADLPAPVDEENLPTTLAEEGERNQTKNLAIQNIKNVSKILEQSAVDVFVLAKSSDSPRVWEVLGGLLKTQLDASKTLMEAVDPTKAKKAGGFGGGDTIEGDTTNIQNNFHIGSMEDLTKLLEGDEDDDEVIENE